MQCKRHVVSWHLQNLIFFGSAIGFRTKSNCALIRRFCKLFASLVATSTFFWILFSVNYLENHLKFYWQIFQWITLKIIWTFTNIFVGRNVNIVSLNKSNATSRFIFTFEWWFININLGSHLHDHVVLGKISVY